MRAQSIEDGMTQTCSQCFKKTLAPFVLKCQHFIHLNCLREQLALTKGGIYREYKCKACGLFTDMGHLKKIYIDDESFNIFDGNFAQDSKTMKPEEMKIVKQIENAGKQKTTKQKKLFLDKINVANLNENADNLLNSLKINDPISNEKIELGGQKRLDQFLGQQEPINFSRCLTHQKEYTYMHSETFNFYCLDCVVDSSLLIDKNKLSKLKKESTFIKEKSRDSITLLSRLKNRVLTNLRSIQQRINTNEKFEKETKQVVDLRTQQIYLELKQLEARYERKIKDELAEDSKELKKLEAKHMKMVGMISPQNNNMNQTDNFTDFVANIARWRYVSQNLDLSDVLNGRIETSIEDKIKLETSGVIAEIKKVGQQIQNINFSRFNENVVFNETDLQHEITRLKKPIADGTRSKTPTIQNLKLNRSKSPNVSTVTNKREIKSGMSTARGISPIPIGKSKGFHLNQDEPVNLSMNNMKKSVGQSKYFGNIFGTLTNPTIFDNPEPQKSNLDQEGQINLDFLRSESKREKSMSLSPAKKSSMKSASKKNIFEEASESRKRTPSGGKERFETSNFDSQPSPVKSGKKVEFVLDTKPKDYKYSLKAPSSSGNDFSLTKDQFLELLIKSSERLQKESSLRYNIVSLTNALPIASMGFLNIKPLLKITKNTRDVNAINFHKRCDGCGPYLGFVETQYGIFGFFVENDFMEEFEVYSKSSHSFIFLLRTPMTGKFVQFKVKKGFEDYALCNTEEGFCLGMPSPNNRDLYMNFDDLSKSSSKLGFAYDRGDFPVDALAGKYTNWNVLEVEIFQIMTNNTKKGFF